MVEIDENAPRDIGSFDEWASACGIQRADGFQLTVTNEDPLDVGVITTQDLPAESPVIFVPNEIMLSSNRAKEELGPATVAEDLFAQLGASDQLPRFYLFVKVLKEYELGDQSPWFPWLNSLPRYFSSGASMTHFCCTEVLPPLVGNLAMRERTRFKQYFKALDYCDFLSPETRANKELAKWAHNVCHTRSFQDGHGDYKIAPMADMVGTRSGFQVFKIAKVLTLPILSLIMTQSMRYKGATTKKGTFLRRPFMMSLLDLPSECRTLLVIVPTRPFCLRDMDS